MGSWDLLHALIEEFTYLYQIYQPKPLLTHSLSSGFVIGSVCCSLGLLLRLIHPHRIALGPLHLIFFTKRQFSWQ